MLRQLAVVLALFLFTGCATQPTGAANPEPVAPPPAAADVTPQPPSAPTATVTPAVSPTVTPSPTASPTSTATPTFTPSPVATALPGVPARVIKVVEGDVLDVDLGGKPERLKLMGIDTPKTADALRQPECYGYESVAHAKKLVEGREIYVAYDPTQAGRDPFQRLYAYVWLPDGRMLNGVMIADGVAFEYTERIPHRYQSDFKAVEQQARAQGRGLWSPANCNGQRQALRPPSAPDTPRPADIPALPKPAGTPVKP